MSIPLRWAPGDRAVVRVTVVAAGVDPVLVDMPNGARRTRAYVPRADLELPPLVVDDPRVVKLVSAARAFFSQPYDNGQWEKRLRDALAALPPIGEVKPIACRGAEVMSPKQRLQEVAKAQMTDIVKRSRAHSERKRAYDAGRAEQRALIVSWLKGVAKGAAGLPPVDRAECVELVAQWIETEAWRSAMPPIGTGEV